MAKTKSTVPILHARITSVGWKDDESNMAQHDIVKVVRCKECKWFDITSPYGTVIPDAYHCKMNDRFYGFEHFCAYGERRE